MLDLGWVCMRPSASTKPRATSCPSSSGGGRPSAIARWRVSWTTSTRPAGGTSISPPPLPTTVPSFSAAAAPASSRARVWTAIGRLIRRAKYGGGRAPGWGSFAIVGPYAVTQEQRGDEELVVCYEVATGKPLWCNADECRFEEVLAGVGPPLHADDRRGSRLLDGRLGTLNCLDGAMGKVIWMRCSDGKQGRQLAVGQKLFAADRGRPGCRPRAAA